MGQCILVVEDQEDNRQILRDLLTFSGFEIVEATDELWVNLGDDGLRGGVSRRVTSLPEPPERSDTPCREIPTFSGSVSLTQSTIP